PARPAGGLGLLGPFTWLHEPRVAPVTPRAPREIRPSRVAGREGAGSPLVAERVPRPEQVLDSERAVVQPVARAGLVRRVLVPQVTAVVRAHVPLVVGLCVRLHDARGVHAA